GQSQRLDLRGRPCGEQDDSDVVQVAQIVPEARVDWNAVAAMTWSPDSNRFASNETYSCASAGKNETQCAAVTNTVGAMRLPLQRASSPVMMPFPSKSKSRAPTLEKLFSPVGWPLMIDRKSVV